MSEPYEPYPVISSETPYRGKILNVRVDTISLPDGRSARREIVERGSASAVVAIDRGGLLTLVRQYRPALGRFALEIPAGMIDPEEDPMACAARELEEETGQKAGKLRFLCAMHMSVGFCTEQLYLYLAEDLTESERHPDEDEFIEIVRCPLDEALGMIAGGVITDSKTVAGVLAVKSGFAGLAQ